MTGLIERLGFARSISSPRSESTLQHPAFKYCAELWRRLPRCNGAPRHEIVPPKEIGDACGIECPAHTAISVVTLTDAEQITSRIHANVISFDSGRQAIAAQTPQKFALTEKFLVSGLDSRNGLFHIVDPKHHRLDPSTGELVRPRSERTPIGQLLNRWQKSVETQEPLILGGRYQIDGLAEISCDEHHACYSLAATDMCTNELVMVPLTQVGLPFDDRKLSIDHIEQANTLVDYHRDKYQPLPESASAQQRHDPAILSKAGIGRCAAVITYREVAAKIDEDGDAFNLLDALEQAVSQGRLDRGKNFLHSEEQLEIVHAALGKRIAKRQQAYHTPPLRLSPHPRRPTSPVPDEVKVNEADPVVSPKDIAHVSRLPSIDYRARTLALLSDHKADNPLQFFDVLADEHPEVAAFCAIQARRALTAVNRVHSDGYEYTSMHDGIAVEIVDSDTDGVFADHVIGIEIAGDADEPLPSMSISELLSRDVSQAIPPSNLQDNLRSMTGPFPYGLPAALKIGKRDDSLVVSSSAPKLSQENIQQFFAENADTSPLQLMESLTENNPSLTTLVHFIEHALLLRDSSKPTQYERYDYVVDLAAEELFFKKNTGEEGQKYFPTFIPGVNRALSSTQVKWTINSDGHSHATNRHTDVYQHVLTQALRHLQCSTIPDDTSGLYPLPIYKLLAEAVGIDPVPSYLHRHEEDIANITRKNRQNRDRVAADSWQACLERDQKREAERAEGEASTAKRHAALGVENGLQEDLLGSNNYCGDLLTRSLAFDVALPHQSEQPVLLDNFKHDLLESHHPLVVSSRSLNYPTLEDHRSWLRTSWLSLFAALTPEQLADRLRSIEKKPQIVENEARVLQAIAEIYRKNPIAFLQGELGIEASVDTEGISAQTAFKCDVVLGSPLPLDQVLHNHPERSHLRLSPSANIEHFLANLQLKAVMAYRSEYKGIERELASLLIHRSPASSTLPIALHRAFGVPLLLAEKSADDSGERPISQGKTASRLRTTAPAASEMATKFHNAFKNHDQVDEDVLTSLAFELSDTAVIWCDKKRYSISLPKKVAGYPAPLPTTQKELELVASPPPTPGKKVVQWWNPLARR